MVSSWRKSKKEEKRSLLSGRHQGSSYKPPKKKNSSFFAKHERTPPVTPGDDDDEFRYDVAIVASEYDPSQSYGMSGPKPIARYPSTPMRKVEFKPDMAPPAFTPPPPLTEESVMESMRHVAKTTENKEESPPPLPQGNSLYTQTLKFIDDICQIPTPQDKRAVNGTREWGTAPSGEEESTYGPSYQTSTTPGESEGFTQYSRSYLASQGSHVNRFTELPEPKEELIEHENYEVVLDMANLAASPQSTPNRNGHSSIKADSKRSMVRRLFSGRKKEDFQDEGDYAFVEKETPQLSLYDEPEIQDDAAVMDYPEFREDIPVDPPANHAREIAVTLVPPTRERSLISPVEEVLNSIGNLFNYYMEEEKKEEEKKEELEALATPKGSFNDYAEEVGPEDEIEENLTPSTSFAETDERSVLASIGAPLVEQQIVEKKDKARRVLNLGVFVKRISKKRKPKKEKPLWLPAVDRKTGRTYWYNRITRESTYHRPNPASEHETEGGAPKPEPKEELPTIAEVSNELMEAPTYGVSARGGRPLNKNQNNTIVTSHKKLEPADSQNRDVDTTPKKKNSKNERPLWLPAVDRKTGRTYWYNRITRQSTFVPPPGAHDPQTKGVAAMPEQSVDPAISNSTVEARNLQPEIEARKAQPKEESGNGMKDAKEEQTGLPTTKPLWMTAVDPNSGRTYWYNRVTRQSTYNPPPEAFMQETEAEMPILRAKLESDLAVVEVWEEPHPESKEEPKPESIEEPKPELKEELKPESKEEPTPRSMEETMPETQDKVNDAPTKKKPLWKTAVNTKNGRTYWYNRVTRESTYNPPPEAFIEETEMGSPTLPKKVEAEVVVVDASAESKLDSKEVPKLDSKEAPKQESKEVPMQESKEPVNETPKKKKPLWKSAVDHNSGRTYWYNRITRESTYNPPPEAFMQETELEAATPEKAVSAVTEIKKIVTETPTSAADVSPEADADSPPKKSKKPTWRAVVDEKTGRTYYYHRKTGETTWKMPEELKALKESEQSVSAHRDAEGETPPLVVSAEVSEESMVRIKKGEEGLLDNSYEREDDAEEQDAFELASTDENPFDEPIVNVGDIPMTRASSASRSGTFMSRTSATTKSSVKTDKTERIRNTAPVNNTSKAIETISETTSNATSISSHHEESRLNTPERPISLVRPRELKVEELTGSRVTAETYDRVGRVMCGKSDDVEEGSYYGENEYGDDSVSALSETEADFSQRKENFEQARRRALDDAIEREDWDLAAALSEGMRATTTTTGEYTKAHQSWNQSELDKFIAVNDWDAVKSYIARMREAKKTVREESPPVVSKTDSEAIDPPMRLTPSSHNVVLPPPTVPESSPMPYEKRIGSRSQVQHERIQQAEGLESDSSSSDDSTELSQSLDEETNYSEYS